MTDADKKLLELAEKATPRPWTREETYHEIWSPDALYVVIKEHPRQFPFERAGVSRIEDAKYIVAAANAVPGLIAENEAMRKRIKRLRNVISDQTIEFAEPSAETEAMRKKWAVAILTADDAAAKVQS